MKLTSVVLHSLDDLEDAELTLPGTPSQDRFVVRQILGLDAEELIPKFYARGLVSGNSYFEYAMKPRQIVIRVVLNPLYAINESVSDIRDELYRFISSNRPGAVQLQFKSGISIVSVINGLITKFEVGYFSKLPELQITVYCPDAMFRSMTPINYAPADLPTVNPVQLADSASTAPHGLSFRIEFTVDTPTFTIQDAPSDPDWKFEISPTGGFDIGDELFVSSEFGQKSVYVDSFAPIYMLDKIDDASVWPVIFPGNNIFYFLPIANFDWIELSYYSAYWGA